MGGGENFLAVFAEFLENEYPGSDIEIITHQGNQIGLPRLAQRFGVTLDRTRLRTIEPEGRSRLLPLRPLRRLVHAQDIANLSSEYDLFVNNTIFSIAPPRARRSLYMCMFPLSAAPTPAPERGGRRSLGAAYRELRHRVIRRWVGSYDLLLANSEFTRGWIRRIWELPSEVLYPPIETRPRLDLERKDRRILSIGRFFPGSHNKKHDVLIAAFRKLRAQGELAGWELHLAGGNTRVDGTDAYLDRLRELAAGEPVHFHLDASRARLEQLLETSSLFWHATGFGEDPDLEPYKLEHFGMSTVEAMTYGCVPVVYRCGGQPEIIASGTSGFLWRTLDELAAQTRLLVADAAMRRTMAVAAHARSQDFSREAFRARARELLATLGHGAPPSANGTG